MLISFIVPVYNLKREELSECIVSLLKQSYNDYEIIIVDDGSNNGIEKYCDELGDKYGITIIHQHNQGLAAARNSGMAKAKGEWIVHVDGDDWVDQNLAISLSQASNIASPDIFVWGYVYYRTDYSLTYLLKNKDAFNANYNDIKENVLCSILDYDTSFSSLALNTSWGKAYRRDFIQKNKLLYDPKLRRAQDAAYNLYAFNTATEVRYIDAALSYYRSDNLSLSRGFNPKNYDYLTATALAVEGFASTKCDDGSPIKDAASIFVQRCFRMINEQYFQHRDNPMPLKERKRLFCEAIAKEPFKSAFESDVRRFRILDRISDFLYKNKLFSCIYIYDGIREYARNKKNSKK